MTRVKEKRIAYCQTCKKQTAWLHVNGVETFWLCLLCATREEAQMTEKPDRHKELFAKVEDTTTAARETLARAHTALDQTRKLLQRSEELLQHRRAWAERKAEHHPRSRPK